jgi:UDP-2,3-diacylglucosamine pyrophosphatase LpxH
MPKVVRVVFSDCHLGTGMRRGQPNPFEDFHEDERLAEMVEHYATGAYERLEVELILNGDIFDLMKVEIDGAFPTAITEALAIEKMRRTLEGHPRVVSALRAFVARPGKRITYIPGNHDIDVWFSGVQQLFRAYVAPGKLEPRVRFVTATDTYSLPEGIQIRHGHQLEAIHRFDYKRMTTEGPSGEPVLALPWGSLWCLEVLYPAKRQRHHLDSVHPFRIFILGSLLVDFRFTLSFCIRSAIHFLKKRLLSAKRLRDKIRMIPSVLKDEIFAIAGYDDAALKALRRTHGVHTLIVGHSHAPTCQVLESGKQYINTGTWTRIVNLEPTRIGRDQGLTYALIEYDDDGQPRTSLMRWNGAARTCEPVAYPL